MMIYFIEEETGTERSGVSQVTQLAGAPAHMPSSLFMLLHALGCEEMRGGGKRPV